MKSLNAFINYFCLFYHVFTVVNYTFFLASSKILNYIFYSWPCSKLANKIYLWNNGLPFVGLRQTHIPCPPTLSWLFHYPNFSQLSVGLLCQLILTYIYNNFFSVFCGLFHMEQRKLFHPNFFCVIGVKPQIVFPQSCENGWGRW